MDSQWLRDAILLSMKGSLATFDDEPGPPEQRDPRFRKLAEGLLYSKKFILTYHLLILLVILGFSAVHWSGKAIRMWRRRATRLQILAADDAYDRDAGIVKPVLQDGGTSSSGSSTLEGTASPPNKDASEETPLLHQAHTLRPLGSLYPRRTLFSRVKAFLMYQPQPIPIFEKTLPSNGTTLMLLAFIGLNIFYCLYNINFNLFELFVLADRFGLVFVANLPLLYLFAAKTQPLKILTGRSYEGLNIFHRRLGELLCLEALLHTTGMFFVWFTLLRPAGFSFSQFIFNKVIVLGLFAFLAYEMIYFTSLGSFRRRWYELFLASHVFLQAVALVFVFFHHSGTQIYVGFALAIFSMDRLVYRIGLKSLTAEADTKVFQDGQTVCLSTNIVKQPCSALSRIFGRSILGGWQATDHVFLTVPSLSRKHIIQAHPFTIASASPRAEDEEAILDLLIRAKDGFSADLLRKVRHHHRLTIRLDGPYGSSHARDMLEDSGLSIVVAGCSGIAVAWPLIQHLLDVSRSTDTEIAPTSLLRRQKIVLVWVVRKTSQLSWIPGQAIAITADKGVEIIIPRPTEDVGRPNLEYIINGLVDEFGEGKKVGIVASGPDSMARCVRNTCAKLVGDGRDVHVAIEKFGW